MSTIGFTVNNAFYAQTENPGLFKSLSPIIASRSTLAGTALAPSNNGDQVTTQELDLNLQFASQSIIRNSNGTMTINFLGNGTFKPVVSRQYGNIQDQAYKTIYNPQLPTLDNSNETGGVTDPNADPLLSRVGASKVSFSGPATFNITNGFQVHINLPDVMEYNDKTGKLQKVNVTEDVKINKDGTLAIDLEYQNTPSGSAGATKASFNGPLNLSSGQKGQLSDTVGSNTESILMAFGAVGT